MFLFSIIVIKYFDYLRKYYSSSRKHFNCLLLYFCCVHLTKVLYFWWKDTVFATSRLPQQILPTPLSTLRLYFIQTASVHAIVCQNLSWLCIKEESLYTYLAMQLPARALSHLYYLPPWVSICRLKCRLLFNETVMSLFKCTEWL